VINRRYWLHAVLILHICIDVCPQSSLRDCYVLYSFCNQVFHISWKGDQCVGVKRLFVMSAAVSSLGASISWTGTLKILDMISNDYILSICCGSPMPKSGCIMFVVSCPHPESDIVQ